MISITEYNCAARYHGSDEEFRCRLEASDIYSALLALDNWLISKHSSSVADAAEVRLDAIIEKV